MNKRDCKIVQDLLPNYIEKLTDEETNKYIEEHIKECEECKNVLENMKKDIKSNDEKRDVREVKYMKKFKNKIRILKFIILLIVLLIVLAFIGLTARKIFIIKNLSESAEKYENYTNIHITMSNYDYDTGDYARLEIFRLDDRIKVVSTGVTDEGKYTKIKYSTEKLEKDDELCGKYIMNIYKETEDGKIACLEQEDEINIQPNLFKFIITEEDYWKNLFDIAKSSKIEETLFNGDEVFYIPNWLDGIYVDSDTGLVIHQNGAEYTIPSTGEKGRTGSVEWRYEFDTVSESDFIKPDISDYELVDEINDGIM